MNRSFVHLACGVVVSIAGAAYAQSPISVQDAIKPVEGQIDSANLPKDEAKPAQDAQPAQPAAAEGARRTTPSGLTIVDMPGNDARSADGDYAIVHYTGKLQNGKKFDSSYDRGQPFTVVIGQGSVIKGWEEGLVGMKVGDRRQLIIPPDLAYGAEEKRDPQTNEVIIPANSTLVFDIEMVGLVKTGR